MKFKCKVSLVLVVITFYQASSFTTRRPFDIQEWIRNQTNHNSTWNAIDVKQFPGEECFRPCQPGQSRVCYWKFVMEHYSAMGVACGDCIHGNFEDCFNLHCIPADGVERGVMSINRQIPGPFIHVCKDDLIVVDVVNAMAGTATSLHWHGLHMKDTPFMDGVPFVTQCPIDFSNAFRYAFWASEPGTQFYHSHSGHHKVNGHYGALIVRNETSPHANLYDFDVKEHTIIISDWMHDDADMFMPGLPTRGPGIMPQSVLINGKGVFLRNESNPTQYVNSPIEVYKVVAGSRYRFRFINSASHVCPVQIQIQNHNLTVISTDSFDVRPEEVNTLITTSGERYDFIVNANQAPGNYCIRVRLLGICNHEQFAILAYVPQGSNYNVSVSEFKSYADVGAQCRDGVDIPVIASLNHPNTTCYNEKDHNKCSSDLAALQADPDLIAAKVDERFYLAFNNYAVSKHDLFQENHYEHFMNNGNTTVLQAAINNISFVFPPVSILTQSDEITENTFCEEGKLPPRCEGKRFCHCSHVIKAKLNSVVELVIIDETTRIGRINHPFHLHGFAMHVMETDFIRNVPMTVELYKKLSKSRLLPNQGRNLRSKTASLQDTISLPSQGYTVLRFRANNPGFWALHCHFEYHFSVGMGLILQVGEPSDFVKPPRNFPQCRNYLPDIDQSGSLFPQSNNEKKPTNKTSEVKINVNNFLSLNTSQLKLHAGEDCLRPCTSGDSKICYFKFYLEYYHAMGSACASCNSGNHTDCFNSQCVTADGHERGFMSVNRKFPGTKIEVCENDTIVVDVENLMAGTSTSIHWHGILQENTQYMDGVGLVTQCPIPFFTEFRYMFKANHAGTHHYHSHAGHHKSNGIAGPLIIRGVRNEDPNSHLYEYDLSEHTIFLNDWIHSYAEMFVPGLPSTTLLPASILINGRSRFDNKNTNIPYSIFRVKLGGRYKFRLINSNALTCPFQIQTPAVNVPPQTIGRPKRIVRRPLRYDEYETDFQSHYAFNLIEKHRMTIIASDASDIKPLTVDTLITTSGERYDFILEANQTKGNYWLRVRAIGQCAMNGNQIESFAILSYYTGSEINDTELAFTSKSPPSYEDSFPLGIVINNPNGTCQQTNSNFICLTDLESYKQDTELLNSVPDHRFLWRFTTPTLNNDILFNNEYNNHYSYFNVFGTFNNVGVINNISFILPQSLIRTKEIKEELFCDETTQQTCNNTNICFCLHRVKMKLNSIVEITLKDESKEWEPIYHPMHLHGHRMVVTEISNGTDITNLNVNNFPPYKDTIAVPSQGHVIVRFRADNPGFWMFHCHFEWHLNIGMNLIVQVGEFSEMTPIPDDFPTCSSYVPDAHAL
uniref:CSON012189 protein n=1 Tax=Culicoides sonorensis TaxID=179676 RepID=A0A336LRE1_CULSO